jgi:hypothetical protein
MATRRFDHIIVIMFENQYRGYVMNNPYMRNLAAQGIELTNSFGVMHPSQTNYIASLAGELCNVTDDEVPPRLPQRTLVDLIEDSAQNLDWRAYMESYVAGWTPWKATNFTPVNSYPYVLKHDPFSSFSRILDSETRWQKIGNEAQFYQDLLNDTLPEFAWFTPNMWHDGHYLLGSKDNDLKGERAPILVDQQADWLKSFFESINFPGPNSKLPDNTLVVVTYDEADFESDYDTSQKYKYYYDGPNQIYTVLLGDTLTPSQQHEGYNHYSLLRTIEENFSLGSLGKNDEHANYFRFLWDEALHWHPAACVPHIEHASELQTASLGDLLYLFYTREDRPGHLYCSSFDGHAWSEPLLAREDCKDQLQLSAQDDTLVLGYRDQDLRITLQTLRANQGWQPLAAPSDDSVSALALQVLPQSQDLLLVYRDQQGTMLAQRYARQQWQSQPQTLVCKPEGTFTLASLGSNTLLIYRESSTHALACLSYNSAEFNVTDVSNSAYAGPQDNAVSHQWSANGFGIGHFSQAPSKLTPDEPEPQEHSYQSEGQLAAATLDGVLHLFHNAPNSQQLLSANFSIPGVLTSQLPVSYDPAKADTTSNGYGTMAEAGWSEQQPLNNAHRQPDTPLCAARYRDQLWCFYQSSQDQQLRAHVATYRSAQKHTNGE